MKWLEQLLGRFGIFTSHREPDIRFVGEQDGPAERDLKSRWRDIFAHNPGICRAHLANVRYGNRPTIQLALCLVHAQKPDPRLVPVLAAPFREMFRDVALDILFLERGEEGVLSRVCPPFYEADGASAARPGASAAS